DPADLAAGESTTDIDGNQRVLDGDGVCPIARDIGAYEFVSGNAPPDCTPPPPPPPDTKDTTAPNTQIDKGPKKKSKKRKPKFTFSADEQGSTFQCKLDKKPFAACSSPLKAKVKKGKHTFQVEATDASGNTDSTPATVKFKVK